MQNIEKVNVISFILRSSDRICTVVILILITCSYKLLFDH